nr:MAG TPA: hypothetical protein [Crassvirales sp.]
MLCKSEPLSYTVNYKDNENGKDVESGNTEVNES